MKSAPFLRRALINGVRRNLRPYRAATMAGRTQWHQAMMARSVRQHDLRVLWR